MHWIRQSDPAPWKQRFLAKPETLCRGGYRRCPQNLILEPTGFTNYSRQRSEYLGYPTRKPCELLEKLLPATSQEGDLVLDSFCGCVTTVVAVHNLRHRWLGIDIRTLALDEIKGHMHRLALDMEIRTEGIPTELTSARSLHQANPFHFETWAVQCIPGMAPNRQQVG